MHRKVGLGLSGSRRQGDDKRRAEPAQCEISKNPCDNHEIIAGIFVFAFRCRKSFGRRTGFCDLKQTIENPVFFT